MIKKYKGRFSVYNKTKKLIFNMLTEIFGCNNIDKKSLSFKSLKRKEIFIVSMEDYMNYFFALQ